MNPKLFVAHVITFLMQGHTFLSVCHVHVNYKKQHNKIMLFLLYVLCVKYEVSIEFT